MSDKCSKCGTTRLSGHQQEHPGLCCDCFDAQFVSQREADILAATDPEARIPARDFFELLNRKEEDDKS